METAPVRPSTDASDNDADNSPDTEAVTAAWAAADFTTDRRVIKVAALAVVIGAIATAVARGLLDLIALCTNLFFYHEVSLAGRAPAGHHLGWLVLLVPVVGSLIVGLMARFGSERIRGHGIPEAIEAILLRGSCIQPRVALLKPLSTAIAIGSGGPFGAEGPIIMTGGAFGSLIAQLVQTTAAERRSLLVAGAAAGMCAVFGTPLAAILLGVELLLFEWKPRSFVPVAMASATAAALRPLLIGSGALFPNSVVVNLTPAVVLASLGTGLAVGVLAALLTLSVYAAEDFFHRLPLHWMWWPALGGVVIGLGGLFVPEAMGVGYDIIGKLTRGVVDASFIGKFLVAKWIIWAVSLGSGTSGGVLAPLLLVGGSLGSLLSPVLPSVGPGFWALVAMGAIMGGTMRAPLTGIVFIVELTHDLDLGVPLVLAVTTAHLFTVLLLRRSILTEKLARRGFHLSCEYEMDPLEIVFVREAMRPAAVGAEPFGNAPVVAHPDEPLSALLDRMALRGVDRAPVHNQGRAVGEISLADVMEARRRILADEARRERKWGAPAA